MPSALPCQCSHLRSHSGAAASCLSSRPRLGRPCLLSLPRVLRLHRTQQGLMIFPESTATPWVPQASPTQQAERDFGDRSHVHRGRGYHPDLEPIVVGGRTRGSGRFWSMEAIEDEDGAYIPVLCTLCCIEPEVKSKIREMECGNYPEFQSPALLAVCHYNLH